MSKLEIADLTLHPACEQVPRMRDEEWATFLEDVKQRGVLEPIVVQRGGVVLDGRHRLEAAKARGDRTIPTRLVNLGEKETLDFIIASAVLRRHLTDDQRSILAARFQRLLSKTARVERARKGGLGRGAKKKTNLSDTSSHKQEPKVSTRKEAASQFKVAERKVRAAATIEGECPALAERVLAGELTLHQAKQEHRREHKRAELKAKAQEVQKSPDEHSWDICHGDCIEILTTLKDPARLIFADPPYNIGIDYGEGQAADRLSDADYGREVFTRGAVIHAIGRKEVERYRQEGMDLSDCEGVQVVCSTDGAVLTVYRNHNFHGLRTGLGRGRFRPPGNRRPPGHRCNETPRRRDAKGRHRGVGTVPC